MLVCPTCEKDVYIQQRTQGAVWSVSAPYYCWCCDEFLNYNEVEVKND